MANGLTSLARHKTLCCLGLGTFVLLLRALLLPVWPIPIPNYHDEFCYLLEADTFAHGRLTNPPHPMWQFFESVYILQRPTYSAKYPPAQGIAMAAGQVLLGNPWYGVWLSCGILAAAICWALQGWMPPRWALLGAVFAIQVCFYSYWMNGYWGGAVAATGGAMAIGAWPRIFRQRRTVYAWTLGAGAVIVAIARPFEGALFVATFLVALLWKTRRLAVWLPLTVVGLAGLGWLGYYQYRVTGNPLRMPFVEYQEQYETVPLFNVLPLAAGTREYHHANLEWMDRGFMLAAWKKTRSLKFPGMRVRDWYLTLKTILGSPFLIIPLLGFLPRLVRSRKMRLPLVLWLVMIAASLVSMPHFPHYAAPFAVAFLILCLQGLRHMGRFAPVLIAVVISLTVWDDARAIVGRVTPDRFRAEVWRKPGLESSLASRAPGRHVVFVRYTRYQEPHAEWLYNSADIDAQRVIWAQDMGEAENRRLIAYYPGRAFWRFEPDEDPDKFEPY